MKIHECTAGDIIAIVHDDELMVCELGALLGGGRGKKRTTPTSALVHPLDPDTLCERAPRECLSIDTDIDVVEVVAPISFLRRMRMKDRNATPDTGDTDPLLGRERPSQEPF